MTDPRWRITPQSPLVLASGSPRRRELLARFGVPLRAVSVDVDESLRPGEGGVACARRLASDKLARALGGGFGVEEGTYVLAADTVVSLGDEICDKPASDEDARRALRKLSGKTHDVSTAFTVGVGGDPAATFLDVVTTRVVFYPLSESTIEAYVRSGEGRDKAGAYGIQGRGAYLVKHIEGSYENVMGLPVVEVLRCLVARGAIDEPFD